MKGFKWKGFVKPQNSSKLESMTVYKGNFLLELVLPNALKINSFIKLKVRLDKWIKSHGEIHLPHQITCTRKQRLQYEELLLKSGHPTNRYFTFQGIPLELNTK